MRRRASSSSRGKAKAAPSSRGKAKRPQRPHSSMTSGKDGRAREGQASEDPSGETWIRVGATGGAGSDRGSRGGAAGSSSRGASERQLGGGRGQGSLSLEVKQVSRPDPNGSGGGGSIWGATVAASEAHGAEALFGQERSPRAHVPRQVDDQRHASAAAQARRGQWRLLPRLKQERLGRPQAKTHVSTPQAQ